MRLGAFAGACVLTALLWPADARVSQWFEDHRMAALNGAVLAATSAWTLAVFVTLAAAGLAWAGRRREAAVLAAVTLLTLGIGSLLKVAIGRRRPYESLQDFVSLTTADDASFPSNHTSGAFAACLLLAAWVPRARPLFVAFAAFIAFTRLYVGVHFASDICGGLALALLTSTLALRLLRPPAQNPAAPRN